MADYSADAVFLGPEGALRGPDAIKPVFERFFAEFAKPGTSFARKQRSIEGDYAYVVWSSETADNFYELASDTFFIQNGSIRMQAFAAKVDHRSNRRLDRFRRCGATNAPLLGG
jgi:hypothetical protein